MSRSDSRARRTRRRPRRPPIARICPGCGEDVAHAPLQVPVWLDQPVRTCPACGLGVAEPRGRRLDPRRRMLVVGFALVRMMMFGTLLTTASLACSAAARAMAVGIARVGRVDSGLVIAGIMVTIAMTGLMVGITMHRRGLQTGGILAGGTVIAWVLMAADPSSTGVPPRVDFATLAVMVTIAILAGPIWHGIGRFLTHVGPSLMRRTT